MQTTAQKYSAEQIVWQVSGVQPVTGTADQNCNKLLINVPTGQVEQ